MIADDLFREGVMSRHDTETLVSITKGDGGRSLVIMGPPGSGKTTLLNWLLEDGYKTIAGPVPVTLIQKVDELFLDHPAPCDRTIIEHDHPDDADTVIKEAIEGRSAGDVVVFGEAGESMFSHIIRANEIGCRTAFTVHAHSIDELINRIAVCIVRSDKNISLPEAVCIARKTCGTIVYMEDFKLKGIVPLTTDSAG